MICQQTRCTDRSKYATGCCAHASVFAISATVVFGQEVSLMGHDSLLTKPASGHWTDAYPELGRGPVSLEDCVSTDFYEKEREHVFRKTWLYMGRVERVPKSGSYFTRELPFLNTSLII